MFANTVPRPRPFGRKACHDASLRREVGFLRLQLAKFEGRDDARAGFARHVINDRIAAAEAQLAGPEQP